MNLSVNTEKNNDHTVVKIAGEIDAYTAPELKESFLPLMKESSNHVQVDLEEVNYMDSTGLGVFVSALKASNESGSTFEVINVHDRVYRIFKITGLDEIIQIKAAIRGGNE